MQLDTDDEDTPFFKPVVQQTEPLVPKGRREQGQQSQASAAVAVDGDANGQGKAGEAGPTNEDGGRGGSEE